MKPYQLIGSPHSAAFLHLRQFMIWSNIPHTVVIADRAVIESQVRARTSRTRLPMVITPDNYTLTNELDIIDTLDAQAVTPLSPVLEGATRIIEAFTTNWLAPLVQASLAANAPSACRERLGQLLLTQPDPDSESLLVARVFRQTCRHLHRLGFDPEKAETLRRDLDGVLGLIEQRLGKGQFLFGDCASRADFALFGPLQLLWQHDPASARLCDACPGIHAWLGRVAQSNREMDTRFAGQPHIPSSARELIGFAVSRVVPAGFEAGEAIADWTRANAGKINLPERLGLSRPGGKGEPGFTLLPEHHWCLQRVLDGFDSEDLHANDREFLEAVGLADIAEWTLQREVRYENHRFRVDLLTRREPSVPDIDFLPDFERVLQEAEETRHLEHAFSA